MNTNNASIKWTKQNALPTAEQYNTITKILNDLNGRGSPREYIASVLEMYAMDNTVFDLFMIANQVKDDIMDIDERCPITFDIAWNSLAQVLVPVGYFPPRNR